MAAGSPNSLAGSVENAAPSIARVSNARPSSATPSARSM
jgi:hypothetical protein